MKRLLIILLLLCQMLYAGTTGKIAGRVIDSQTKEPLPMVNLTLVGTTMGAVSDFEGNYFIINVPIGIYSLRASMVGYTAKTISNIKVMLDITTTVDIALEPSTVMAKEVVVTAQRPPIQIDLTSTKYTIDEGTITALPVDNFQEIVRMQAGVNGSHFRGGRFNESLFLIDGLPVKTAVNGYVEYTGGFAITLPQLSVSEIQISTGGFEAEYGNAQSGIVNTITRSPFSRFSAKFRVRTSDFPWSKVELRPNQFGKGQPDWKNYEFFFTTPNVSLGDVKLGLNVSSDVALQNKGLLQNESSYREAYQSKVTLNYGEHRIQLSGVRSWSRSTSYSHYYSMFGPLSEGYQKDLFQRLITSSGVSTLEQYFFVPDPQNYHNARKPDSALFEGKWYKSVKNYYQAGMLKHRAIPINDSYNLGLQWNYTLNKQSFLDVKLSMFTNTYRLAGRDVDDRNGDGSTNDALHYLRNGGPGGYMSILDIQAYWNYTGDQGYYLNQVSRTTSLRADYSNQLNTNNLLKGGFEFSYSKGDVEKVTFESVLNPRFDLWNEGLYDAAFYIQDKIEVRDGFILNAGVRFDYYNPNGFGGGVLYPSDPIELTDPARRATLSSADKVSAHWQVSPRIGISHPITERDKIHFYYGHFFQRPDLRFLYENIKLDFRFTTNVDLGNPRLNPEKTVSYEIGWEHLFSDWVKMGVTGYFKDITNLLAAIDYDIPGSAEPFQAYGNMDYANVRGLEFTLETLGNQPIGGMVNYTYALANGRSSSVYRSNGQIVPRRLDPLDWDIRHKFNVNLILRSTGIVDQWIGDAEMNFVATFSSGSPYTTNTRDVFPLFSLRNDGRLPWTKNVDMRFRKSFQMYGLDWSVLAEARNLFNWINVNYISGGREGLILFDQTGDPTGPFKDPNAYSRPRVYRLGLEIQY
ncbi:MAG: TonB-dependent receptor [bacterium]